jgi:hypothetical protein
MNTGNKRAGIKTGPDETGPIIKAIRDAIMDADADGLDLDGLLEMMPHAAVLPLDEGLADDGDWEPGSLEVLLCNDCQVFLRTVCSEGQAYEALDGLLGIRNACFDKAAQPPLAAQALERVMDRSPDRHAYRQGRQAPARTEAQK